MDTSWKSRFTVVPAVYVIVRRGNEMLLMKREGGFGAGQYGLPAGHLDGGESAITAAIRELAEEIGIHANAQDLRFCHVVHARAEGGDHERVDLFFELTKWQGEPQILEPEKCSELCWANVDKLPRPMVQKVATVLRAVSNGEQYSEMYFD